MVKGGKDARFSSSDTVLGPPKNTRIEVTKRA